MLKIDGSYGEGGGQILRTSLSLAILTNQPIEIFNIRAKRKKPGLQAQHLAAVKAAEKICQAKVSGARISSKILRFEPRKIKFGKFEFDIGTAGSTTLVAQTVLLPLSFSKHPSEVLIIGGTHNPLAPSFHYFSEIFLPMIEELGIKTEAKLERYGFYPKGGGRIRLFIEPTQNLKAKEFLERGTPEEICGFFLVANLPIFIAERQKSAALSVLKNITTAVKFETKQVQALSSGTFVFLKAKFSNVLAGFSSLGERGKPTEKVGQEVAEEFLRYYQSNKSLDPYLADQVVLYLAISKKPFAFTVSKITNHLLTHLWLLEKFLGVQIKIDQNKNRIFL